MWYIIVPHLFIVPCWYKFHFDNIMAEGCWLIWLICYALYQLSNWCSSDESSRIPETHESVSKFNKKRVWFYRFIARFKSFHFLLHYNSECKLVATTQIHKHMYLSILNMYYTNMIHVRTSNHSIDLNWCASAMQTEPVPTQQPAHSHHVVQGMNLFKLHD